jgi:hypothetical protein
MSVTALTGMVDTNTILVDERIVDMSDVIGMLDPQTSQFTTMLMKIAQKKARNQKVEWLEDQLFPRLSATAGSQLVGDTVINVVAGQGQYFRANAFVRNARTGEGLKVVSVATDALTVVRGIGAVAAAAMNAGDQLLIVGNASMQGQGLGTMKVVKRVMNFNYTQIQRDPYGFTNTLIATDLYTGGEPDYERKKKLVEHKRAIEYLLFWGARFLDTTGQDPIGYAGGIVEFIATNIHNVAGSLTKSSMDTYFQQDLQHGSENKVLFCAPQIATELSSFLRDNWVRVDAKARLWGSKVDALISGSYGFQIPVIVKRDWNDFSTASSQYGGWAFLVDLDYVKLRPLRETRLLRNRQNNDVDGYDEEYLTEFTLEFQQERVHGLYKGVV